MMLELKNLSFEVEGASSKKEIIKNINLTIDDHKFVCITGPNGGGKSTLAKLIMGIEKPTSGQILFNGLDITNMSITERAKAGISFAFQQPVRFKGIKVRDLITLSAGNAISTAGACDFLSKVGLCARDYINRDVDSSLSGGELKRIEIATIIARNTPLSVFDEPEAGIDLWSFNNLIKVFEDLHSQLVFTVYKKGGQFEVSRRKAVLTVSDIMSVHPQREGTFYTLKGEEQTLSGHRNGNMKIFYITGSRVEPLRNLSRTDFLMPVPGILIVDILGEVIPLQLYMCRNRNLFPAAAVIFRLFKPLYAFVPCLCV
jgi:Fe-S cluster assembly ATP-binding protein